MKSQLAIKFKIARESLGLSQEESAQNAGLKQPTISKLESNKMSYLQPSYLYMLSSKNIDLNKLFDASITPGEFERLCRNAGRLLPAHVDDCPSCAVKEEKIKLLEKIVRTQERSLDVLSARDDVHPPRNRAANE